MSSDELVRDFLEKGGEVRRLEPVEPKNRKVKRRGKWKAAMAFRAGGKLS